jgi:hypothetical protein
VTKRRVRHPSLADQVVVVPRSGTDPMVFEQAASGVRLVGPWRPPEAETASVPGAALVILPAGHALSRVIDLPQAAEAQLEAALQLQVGALQLGNLPSWRSGHVVLPEDGVSSRRGVVVEWPEGHDDVDVPRDLPPEGDPLFAGDVAALVALLQAGAEGPLLSVAPERDRIAFALRTAGGIVLRSTQLDPAAWPDAAELAVVESAVARGADAARLEALLLDLREAMRMAHEGGFGCTRHDQRVLARCVEAETDPAWWRAHGLSAGAALAWFGPLRPLVSLRRQPAGERAGAIGDVLNRLADRSVAIRLAVSAVLALAIVPPVVSGARLLLLEWKVGDLAERERSIQAHRERVALYGELQRRAWPMGKLLGDLACVTPEGIDWDDIQISLDRNVMVRGVARPHDGKDGTEVILLMERQMRDSRIFDKIQKKWDPPDSKGSVSFTLSAVVSRPTLRPNWSEEQDFGRRTLAERRYGPAEPAEPAPEPPPTTELPPVQELTSSPEPAAEGPASPANATEATSTTEPVTGDAAASVETVGEGEAVDAGATRGTRGIRRSGRPVSSGDGLARRSERTPASSDAETPIPPPLSDEQIAAMTRAEAQEAASRVAMARKRAPDEETEKRLRDEFNKLMKRTRELAP